MNIESLLILISVAIAGTGSTQSVDLAAAAVVVFPGHSVLYYDNQTWNNATIPRHATNISDTVRNCQSLYPTLNITNAMEIFQKDSFLNWCRNSTSCRKNGMDEGRLFYCINSTYQSPSINIKAGCNYYTLNDPKCLPYEAWRAKASKQCREDHYLDSMQLVTSKRTCNEPMEFVGIAFLCCPKDIRYYYMLRDKYGISEGLHKERFLFTETKRTLKKNYDKKMEDWKKDMINSISTMIHQMQDKDIDLDALERVKQASKRKYVNITKWFKDEFLKIDEIHINRTIKKAGNSCSKKTESECLNHLQRTINQLKAHFDHISQKGNITVIIDYKSFFLNQLNLFQKKYAHQFKGHQNLSASLQSFSASLEMRSTVVPNESLFEKEFKEEYLRLSQFHNNHSHGTPLMSIIVTTVILLILILLTFVATITIKCCGQPLRRSPPNYVMSVVFNTNQTQGNQQRLDQPPPVAPPKQGVRLNLYENPIFNSKSASKPVEKQSLIENMES